MSHLASTVPAASATRTPAWRRRTSRRRMWRMVTGSYAIDVAIVSLFAMAGTVSWRVPLLLGAGAALVSAIFYVILTRSNPQSTRDPYWTVPQMVAACVVQLAGIAFVPQLATVFLNVLFVVFAFGSLRLSARQLLAGIATIGIALSVVLLQVGPHIELPHHTPLEVAVLSLCYAITLARCAVVGLHASWLTEQLRASNEQLASFSERIDHMAHFDELTGLMNRRAIRAVLDDQLALAGQRTDRLYVALLDLDRFKNVNDRFGHAIGDEVLREFAKVVLRAKRGTEHFGRYGGEEFLYLLSASCMTDARTSMERVRAAVMHHDWGRVATGLAVTVSIGVAQYEPGQLVPELMQHADAALYEAKRQGRDRVVLAA